VKTLGIPRMEKEAGERRDFLPSLLGVAADAGWRVVLQQGVGQGLGLELRDYQAAVRALEVVERRVEAYACDAVLVLRSPEVEEYPALLRRGSTLLSMLHLPTRPRRVRALLELGCEAISLDGLTDDAGQRLVENTRAVAWNGLETAFDALAQFSPWRLDPRGPTLRVTIMGAGRVGRFAAEAAIKYGNRLRWAEWSARGVPPVMPSLLGRRLVGDPEFLRAHLGVTDVLVDATQRDDVSEPLLRNETLDWLPAHAVVCDLNVDPYVPNGEPPTVRGIEGIPMGSLDQQVFRPSDPDWERDIPKGVDTRARRTVVSCSAWPGLHPLSCMEHYGRQLEPVLRRFLVDGLVQPPRDELDRALLRASLAPFRQEPVRR
jgi:alanine dehydrogenase